MSGPTPRRLLRPARVRAARARLLTGAAVSLVEQVRGVFCQPTRAQMVRALSAGPLAVTDLAAAVGRSRSAVSQHLRVLHADGVVQRRRVGRVVYYRLTVDPVARSSLDVLNAVASAAS